MVEEQQESQAGEEDDPDDAPSRGPRWGLRALGAASLIIIAILVAHGVREMRASHHQAKYFTKKLADVSWTLEPKATDTIIFPTHGPYDERLGYTRIDETVPRLVRQGYELTHQADWSPGLRKLVQRGLFPPYVEKQQAGLRLIDANGEPMYVLTLPRDAYRDVEDIPAVVLKTLLFIENRSLLELDPPTKNPAIEWVRLANAALENVLDALGFESDRPSGGSTLATQVEKFRHSPGGRTHDVEEKLRQIESASFRAYLHGPDTLQARKRIILDYINGVPLAANPRVGEVFGLRDALHVWFNAEPERVDELLTSTDISTWQEREERALAYRRMLALILAERRPSDFLVRRRDVLDEVTDSYLRVMRDEGVIPKELANEALEMRSLAVERGVLPEPEDFGSVKTLTTVREQVRQLVGETSLHTLDRIDLEAQSTIEFTVQERIKAKLESLDDPQAAEQMGLVGHRLLDGDAKGIVFGFTLYERTELGSALRLQVDTYEQPLNINEGIKLDLGSTAKLRTLAAYLQIIADLHAGLSQMSPEQRSNVSTAPDDVLTLWVLQQLKRNPDLDLAALLEAAMLREYSASPGETFFTGGGAHRFHNFDADDNGRRVTVRHAFQRSINLPFVRIMRDIVRFHTPRLPNAGPTLYTDPAHKGRAPRLEAFVESESAEYLRRFYDRYAGKSRDQAIQMLIARRKNWTQVPLATAIRSVAPDLDLPTFSKILVNHFGPKDLDEERLQELYDKHGPGTFDWNDRGYLASIHPLELWMIKHRRFHDREPTWDETLTASREIRRTVYNWLFKPKKFNAQNTRLRIMLEREAFERVHESWRRLGFPFDEVTPSLATAIGSAADRPDALARLVGIIAAGGVALDRYTATNLHFAANTPYDTRFERKPVEPTRVMRSAVAERLREELVGVVQQGTARRLQRAEPFASNPAWIVGGKTGTGDHRRKTFDRAGRVTSEVPVSRSATFVFFIGDRFHGTITAFVEGEAAARHEFTSSLPVAILKELAVDLAPIIGAIPQMKADEPPRKVPREFVDGVMFYDEMPEQARELVIY